MKNIKNWSRREFLKAGSLALLAGGLSSAFGSVVFSKPSKTPFEDIRIAFISDPHVDIYGKDGMKMSSVSRECVRITVDELNRDSPKVDAVVVVGDLVTDGEWENVIAIKEELDKLKSPYYVIAGNHDFKPMDNTRLREGYNYLTIDEFIKYFRGHGYDKSGTRYYAHRIAPGLRLIGLDACLPLEPGKWGGVLPKQQLHWLDGELTEHPDDLNLIVIHHNLVRWTDEEAKEKPRQWFCVDNEKEVQELLTRHNPAAPVVVSGHRHVGLNRKKIGGVNYFVTPSLNSHPMRYTTFTISNTRLSWDTKPVGVDDDLHRRAREHLLGSKWWRLEEYVERTPDNDAKCLEFFENNKLISGKTKF